MSELKPVRQMILVSLLVFLALLCLRWYWMRPTPLDCAIAAIKNGNQEELSELLNQVDVNATIQDPNPMLTHSTLLMHATELSNVEIVELLLEQGADPRILRGDGSAAIHIAAKSSPDTKMTQDNSVKILKALAQFRDTVNLRPHFSDPPLYMAALSKSPCRFEKAKILLEQGANTTFRVRIDDRSIWEWLKDDPEMTNLLRARKSQEP